MPSTSEIIEGNCILVCAPFGRDAVSVAGRLREAGFEANVCVDLRELAAQVDDRVGAVLLTEEAFTSGADSLAAAIASQPSWSDLPFVLLAARRQERERRQVDVVQRLMPFATNVVVLERPLGSTSLISAVGAALRARSRQFENRDHLRALAASRAALGESEDRLRLAMEAGAVGLFDYDLVANRLQWDQRCRELFGAHPDENITYEGSFVPRLHPEDRATTEAAVARAIHPVEGGRYDVEYRVMLADGGERWIAATGRVVFVDTVPTRFIGTVVDVTARRTTRSLLEQRVAERTSQLQDEMAHRAKIEAALRQSQKMEAVGQLTGGIAHDFNNMLTGVIGSLDILKRRIASNRLGDLDRFMDAAVTSAQRAAALTSRLLAFSRRQSLDSKPLDINLLVGSLEDLVARTITEKIRLRVVLDTSLPRGTADSNQLESAILNLAINARDAMPDGGEMTIETTAVVVDEVYSAARPDFPVGHYVVVSISDTGVGMTPEILEKVFDPFFTTKPIGQGTGLGLSMVYGFARQSGGFVRIHSKPGVGTSVKVYLPVTDEELQIAKEVVSEPVTKAGLGQTVLVVEDDASVRLLIREVLEELGYCSVEAAEPQIALPILASERAIDLMISDVGLPGMNGRQLAEVARQHRPRLPILFVTGYAENAAIRSGFLGTNMGMITKPFALEVLAGKIDEMLAG